MLHRQELETRVLVAVERVLAGGKVEDDFIECKAAWPTDAGKTARIIAGHANAARSEDIIWIIGLDENGHRLGTLDGTDLSNWWPAIERRFEDPAPAVRSMSVAVSGGSVMALNFETDRSPYVVTTAGNAGVDREVPWRSGTTTRTAHRRELLLMLTPAVAAPALDIPWLEIWARPTYDTENAPGQLAVSVEGGIFAEAADTIVMPEHRWSAEVDFGQGVVVPLTVYLIHHANDTKTELVWTVHRISAATFRGQGVVDESSRDAVLEAQNAKFEWMMPVGIRGRVARGTRQSDRQPPEAPAGGMISRKLARWSWESAPNARPAKFQIG